MTRIVFVSILLLLLASPVVAETRAEREAAARRYLTVVSPLELVEEASLSRFRSLPPVDAHELAKAFVEELELEPIERALINALVRDFTVAELEALTAFYESPNGRTAMRKLARSLDRVRPAMQGEIDRAFAAVQHADPEGPQPLAAPAP